MRRRKKSGEQKFIEAATKAMENLTPTKLSSVAEEWIKENNCLNKKCEDCKVVGISFILIQCDEVQGYKWKQGMGDNPLKYLASLKF